MKKLFLLAVGMATILLGGCSQGCKESRNEVVECVEDSTPCCPPLGYVIELQPLGDFSNKEAERLREELVKQLTLLFGNKTEAELDASFCVKEKKEIPASCQYKPRNRYWAGAILKMLHEEHGGNDEIVTIGLTEFLHSRGLPHCKKDHPKCLMQDAHGKNTFYMKHGLCEDCKKAFI